MYESGGSNFTLWLQDNLDVSNEAAEMGLSGVQDEGTSSAAGIVARDASGGAVVIENEPDESGDAGLGRLMTSLASVRATSGVWIVAGARPDHLAAVSWLNETTRAAFYLLKVEAFRIDDSPPAPVMTLVSGPPQPAFVSPDGDAAAPAMGEAPVVAEAPEDLPSPPQEEPIVPLGKGPTEDGPATHGFSFEAALDEASADGLAVESSAEPVGVATQEPPVVGRDTTGLLLYQFWTELLEKAAERTRIHADAVPLRENVVMADADVEGISYSYVFNEHDAAVELYIDRGEDRKNENELASNALQATEDAISHNFGGPLEWRRDETSSAR